MAAALKNLHYGRGAICKHTLSVQAVTRFLRVPTVVIHHTGAEQAAAHTHVIIVKSVRWCGMDNACAHICSHESCVQNTVSQPRHRVDVGETDELRAARNREGRADQAKLHSQRVYFGGQQYDNPFPHHCIADLT